MSTIPTTDPMSAVRLAEITASYGPAPTAVEAVRMAAEIQWLREQWSTGLSDRYPVGLDPEWPECEEFYSLCQIYRHTPNLALDAVSASYEALKYLLRGEVATLKAQQPREPGERDCVKCGEPIENHDCPQGFGAPIEPGEKDAERFRFYFDPSRSETSGAILEMACKALSPPFPSLDDWRTAIDTDMASPTKPVRIHTDDCMYVRTGEHGCSCGGDARYAQTKEEKL